MVINRTTRIDKAEEVELWWEKVVEEAEEEAETMQERTHDGSMLGSMTGPSVRTTKTAQIIVQTGMLAVVVEDVNNMDEVEVDLVEITSIIQDAQIINKAAIIRTRDKHNSHKIATTMDCIVFQHQIGLLELQHFHQTMDHITQTKRLHHQAM